MRNAKMWERWFKKRPLFHLCWSGVVLIGSVAIGPRWGHGQETLVYSCSAQVHEAFETERLNAFEKATGIKVDLYVTSSAIAIERLKNGFSALSSSATPLDSELKAEGYVETVFCKDPMAVIANPLCKIENLSLGQTRKIFTGEISDWQPLGGPNQPIVLVIPKRTTGAYRNFSDLVMNGSEIRYDVLTDKSVFVIKVVEHLPYAISFTSYGAAASHPGVKVVRIDGVSPGDKAYPYFQTFSFVTKGKAVGAARKFIDFALSDAGLAMMRKRGLTPLR
jgi:phosphate transport system substrate-binding protein